MDLHPEELLLVALVRRALKNAVDGKVSVGEEALHWLWENAPVGGRVCGVATIDNGEYTDLELVGGSNRHQL